MNYSSARSERITAIISTVVAVIILAGGVTAYQTNTAPVDDIVQLESDLRFQLEVAFKHDPNERAARLVELSKVSQAWLNSPRSDADREQLARWLLESTIRSMPGSLEPLPAMPTFGAKPQRPEVVTPDILTPDIILDPPVIEKPSTPTPEPVAELPTPTNLVSSEVPPTTPEQVPNNSEVEGVEFSIQTNVVPAAAPPTTLQPMVATRVEEPEPVQINLTELAARIAGYHAGLDEIEKQLLTISASDFGALTEQLRLLEELTRDYHFVQLYYEALSPTERQVIVAPRAMTDTLGEIEQRLDHAQAEAADDFLGEFDAANQERLGALRELLAKVAARVSR